MIAICKFQFSFSQRLLHIRITCRVRAVVRHPHMPAPEYLTIRTISGNHPATTGSSRSHTAINTGFPFILHRIQRRIGSICPFQIHDVRMVILRSYDSHYRLTDVSILFGLPKQFHRSDSSGSLTPTFQYIVRFIRISILLVCQRIKAEAASGGYHKAIGRRYKVFIIFRSGYRVDIGHPFITCRDTAMCKVHRIIIIRIALNVEIRRLPPADINTIVQFNFCILIAHRDKVKERTSFRSILFCPLGFRVRCRFLSAHIGRYPARVTSALCHIFYLQSSKLIQDRRIISLTIGGRDNRIV